MKKQQKKKLALRIACLVLAGLMVLGVIASGAIALFA